MDSLFGRITLLGAAQVCQVCRGCGAEAVGRVHVSACRYHNYMSYITHSPVHISCSTVLPCQPLSVVQLVSGLPKRRGFQHIGSLSGCAHTSDRPGDVLTSVCHRSPRCSGSLLMRAQQPRLTLHASQGSPRESCFLPLFQNRMARTPP